MVAVLSNPADEARATLTVLDQPAVIRLVDASQTTAGPLADLTVAVKDNIDVAGVPTTAADPRRTTPATEDAAVVALLRAAGAAPVAKTNMDQYATGLVGTRTPYGACHSVASAEHVSGGSSSGSAVAVATGAVSLALGTDTAGSGRVPAAFNGIIGWKPTRGLLSTSGVLPACPSLDCVSTFTRDVVTAQRVYDVVAQPDPIDPWSRPAPAQPVPGVAQDGAVVGVPGGEIDLDPQHRTAWLAAVDRLRDLMGGRRVVEVPVDDLLEAARLLYTGPWVAERLAAFGEALVEPSPQLDPTVRQIVLGGEQVTGADTFRGLSRIAELQRRTRHLLTGLDAVLLPVTPTHPTLAAVREDPIGVNSRLGTYTNMVNLLDLAAVAVPAGTRPDGLPFGVQLLGPAFSDRMLLGLAARWMGEPTAPDRPAPGWTRLAVVGAHLTGQPLNHQVLALGGRLTRRVRTSDGYRMYQVDGPRPGLVRSPDGRRGGFEAEVWELPDPALAAFLPMVAPPLALGPVVLDDDTTVTGFLLAGPVPADAPDLTHLASWRDRPTI